MTDSENGEQAVIRGTYANFAIVKTRGVAQIVVEVPIENAEQVIKMLGIPQPGKEAHVAVAKLRTVPETKEERSEGERAIQRAALLCKEDEFQNWLYAYCGAQQLPTEHGTATLLKEQIGILSRSELKMNMEALEKFLRIEAAYREATGRQAEAR